jgi:hypothetical protein
LNLEILFLVCKLTYGIAQELAGADLYMNGYGIILASARGSPKGVAAGLQPPPPPNAQNRNLKNTYFAYIMISRVLRDLPFSRNQPLKLSND